MIINTNSTGSHEFFEKSRMEETKQNKNELPNSRLLNHSEYYLLEHNLAFRLKLKHTCNMNMYLTKALDVKLSLMYKGKQHQK